MQFNKKEIKKNGQPRPKFFTQFSVLLPVKYISVLSKETKLLLEERGVITLEQLIKVDTREYPAGTGLDSLLKRIREKPYLIDDELRVLKYINDLSKIHLKHDQARVLLSISVFNFLFNDKDLKEVLEQMLPSYYSEKPKDWRRQNQTKRLRKVVFLNAKMLSKKIA